MTAWDRFPHVKVEGENWPSALHMCRGHSPITQDTHRTTLITAFKEKFEKGFLITKWELISLYTLTVFPVGFSARRSLRFGVVTERRSASEIMMYSDPEDSCKESWHT